MICMVNFQNVISHQTGSWLQSTPPPAAVARDTRSPPILLASDISGSGRAWSPGWSSHSGTSRTNRTTSPRTRTEPRCSGASRCFCRDRPGRCREAQASCTPASAAVGRLHTTENMRTTRTKATNPRRRYRPSLRRIRRVERTGCVFDHFVSRPDSNDAPDAAGVARHVVAM